MLIKFKRDVVLKPLTQVIGFVERKQTMPILSNIYFKKIGEQVVIVASDLEIQATLVTDGIEGDDFTITLPAKKFQDILRSLPSDDITLVVMDNNKVEVKSGRAKFVLQSLSADLYPLLEMNNDVVATITLPQSQLRAILNKIQYSMATNDTRIFLNGMLFEIKDNALNLVATDAHRLGYIRVELPSVTESINSIIPRKTVLELSRLLSDDGDVVVKFTPTQVVFEAGNKQLITKILEGRYPDYTRVIPIQNDKLCLINREEFLHAVQRVAVIGIDKLKTLTINLKPNLLTISCRNEEQEESRDELVVQYGYETELQVNINLTYVLEVLQNTTEECLQWAFFDNQRSILITIPNSPDFKYVIMPMRA